VLDGLAAYVRALDPAACPAQPRERVTTRLLMSDARRALLAARAEIAQGDTPSAVLMLAAVRARLGLIDERLDAPGLAALRARLRQASMQLGAAQAALRAGRAVPDAQLAAWLSRTRPLEADLVAAEPGSLFNPHRLAQAAKRRLPG
jgi:hypothetical protein